MGEKARSRKPAVLLRFVAAVAVGGALLAALAVPWVIGPGVLAARVAHVQTRALPVATVSHVEQAIIGNTEVLAADGSLITEFYRHDRVPVRLSRVAPVMRQAQIDIEDSRFYQHGAIDAVGALRALLADASSGAVRQGGSTLTQQLVKQTLVQEATTPAQRSTATADTLSRKLDEAKLAIALEKRYTKDQILERYLNTVYYGHGAYGVEAAARTYFSVSAAQLSLDQAATIAGLVQDPSAYDPIDHPAAAQARRNEVLDRMYDLRHISAAQLADAKAQPVTVQPSPPPPNGCAQAVIGGFFCDFMQQYLTSTLHIGTAELEDGGLTITTTLRPDLQKAGDQAVVANLPMDDSRAAIFDVVQPGTGHVLAMSVNRRFGCSDIGCTSVNLGTAAGQGSGSTYKIFTSAYALQHGYNMSFTQTTSDPYTSTVYKNGDGPYIVSNAGHYPPTLNFATALVMSSNTWFVGLEDHLGSVTGPVETAQRMGLFSLSDAEAQKIIAEQRGSFTLGAEATSPLALASAYSTVYAHGTACAPTPVTSVVDASGHPATDTAGRPVAVKDQCTPDAIPPNVADTLAQVLRGDVQSSVGTARRANIPGHDISGKTGTSQSNFSVAFVGATPEYTGSVMVYNPQQNQDVGGFGGDKGAQVWHDAMQPFLAGQQTAAIPPADRGLLAVPAGGNCPFTVGNLPLNC